MAPILQARAGRLIGVEITLGLRAEASDLRKLKSAAEELGLARVYLADQGAEAYSPLPGIHVMPAKEMLGTPEWRL